MSWSWLPEKAPCKAVLCAGRPRPPRCNSRKGTARSRSCAPSIPTKWMRYVIRNASRGNAIFPASAQSELGAAGRPGTPALSLLQLLSDPDLLLAARLVWHAAAARRMPATGRELEATVITVAGAGAPVAAGLALRQTVPDATAGD